MLFRSEELLQRYLEAWEALSEDSFDESLEALREMAQITDEIGKSNLQGYEKRMIMWYVEELDLSLKKLSKVQSFEHLRSVFVVHSNWLVAFVETGWIAKRSELEKKFCPMASSNQGAFWIQDEHEIRNPYFGSDMLNCGENRHWSQ